MPRSSREREPRRDVRVVVEPRHEDLVAGLELARERAREEEVERRHVLAERDLARVAAEERARALVRCVDQRVGPPRRLVGRADVRVVLAEVAARSRRSPRRGTASRPGRRRTRARRSRALKRARTAASRRRGRRSALTPPSRRTTASRQRRADEAVALRLREQVGDRRLVRLRLEGDVSLDRDLDEREPAVRLATRHGALRGAPERERDPCADAVEAEARQRAAGEPGEQQVLRRPRGSSAPARTPPPRSDRASQVASSETS